MFEPRSFYIREGKNENYFIQNEVLNMHLLLGSGVCARVYHCFPEHNEGIGLLVSAKDGTPVRPSVRGRINSYFQNGKRCFSYELTLDKNEISIDALLIDSVRGLRELKNGSDSAHLRHRLRVSGSVTEIPDPDFVAALGAVEKHYEIRSHRANPRGDRSQGCVISFPASYTWTRGASSIVVKASLEQNLTLTVSGNHDSDLLHALATEDLLSETARKSAQTLSPADREVFDRSLRNFGFLAYREKLLAGSWRFLSYFGRDTLMTIMLLGDTVPHTLSAAALQSVIDRVRDDGAVAHEEDIGYQALFRHRLDAEQTGSTTAGLGNVDVDVENDIFDYKMVDDDFLLCIAVDRLLTGDQNAFRDFISRPSTGGRANADMLIKNIDYCFGKVLEACVENGATSQRNRTPRLIAIDDDLVGDWRDSGTGLGGGRYPVSVNCGLVSPFLESARKILSLIDSKRTGNIAKLLGPEGKLIQAYWESVPAQYQCRLDTGEIRERLKRYLDELEDESESGYFRKRTIGNGMIVQDLLDGAQPHSAGSNSAGQTGVWFGSNSSNGAGLNGGLLEFPALSLDGYGTRVEVMNSDISFRLFFCEPGEQELRQIMALLRLPFPLGLASEVGIVVANAAYSDNAEIRRNLDKKAYHGAVVWSWQNSMIQKGLMRQARIRAGRGDRDTAKELLALTRSIRGMEKKAGELVNSELWTYKIENETMIAQAYGGQGDSDTESNAVQLWSAASMSVILEYNELEAAFRT